MPAEVLVGAKVLVNRVWNDPGLLARLAPSYPSRVPVQSPVVSKEEQEKEPLSAISWSQLLPEQAEPK